MGTSRSYLKTLGNCLLRNNILTLCQDNWDSSDTDIIIAHLWLVSSCQCCLLIGWHSPGPDTTIIIWIVATESIFIFIPAANTETLTLDSGNQIRVQHLKYFETSINIFSRKKNHSLVNIKEGIMSFNECWTNTKKY